MVVERELQKQEHWDTALQTSGVTYFKLVLQELSHIMSDSG